MLDFVTLTADTNASGVGSAQDVAARFGKLLAIGLDYHADIDAGTVVTVTVENGPGPALTLLTRTASKTDDWFYVREAAVLPANTAITNSAVEIPFYGNLKVAVSGAGATPLTGGVKATIFYENR